jgi:hypothetical protein
LLILAILANAAKVPKLPNGTGDARWSKPKPRFLKLNVDVSFYVEQRAGATPLPYVASAAMAEAMAMKLGLELT